jgi:proline dehydrogenase
MRACRPLTLPACLRTQVIPYLLRRAAENSTIMQGAKRDVHLLRAELVRRLKAGQLFS